jgi:hypothetical protein
VVIIPNAIHKLFDPICGVGICPKSFGSVLIGVEDVCIPKYLKHSFARDAVIFSEMV